MAVVLQSPTHALEMTGDIFLFQGAGIFPENRQRLGSHESWVLGRVAELRRWKLGGLTTLLMPFRRSVWVIRHWVANE